MFDDTEDNSFDFFSVEASFRDCRPVVVTLIEIIPVHLVDANRESFFILGVNSLLDHAIIYHFIDVDSGSVSKVEDERVPKCFCSHVEGFLS